MEKAPVPNLEQYREQRQEYLRERKSFIEQLDPQTQEEFLVAKEVVREETREKLQELIDFRTEAGEELGVTLYHTSDKNVWDGHLEPDKIITLVPGMHNKWGTGVYFSEEDLFATYQKRRQTEPEQRADKPITFSIAALNLHGVDAFKRYNDPEQGKGRHSQRGLVHLIIDGVEETEDRVLVSGTAEREEISRDELRKLRRKLGIKKGGGQKRTL